MSFGKFLSFTIAVFLAIVVTIYPRRADALFGVSEDIIAILHDATNMLISSRSDMANRLINEGIASWQAKEAVRRDMVRNVYAMEQPETTCGSMAQARIANKVDQSVAASSDRKSAMRTIAPRFSKSVEPGGSSMMSNPVVSNVNGTEQIIKTYDYVTSNFCTERDVELKRCTKAATKYPGGDMRAELLFGTDGNPSVSDSQTDAVDAFISNIVDSMAPELLRDPQWDKTPEGRKYVLMIRQYAAFLSLSRNSFLRIQENHKAILGLGDMLELTKDPRFADRHDISRMEASSLYIKTQWSPAAIKDMATAVEPHKILRSLAIMNSYRLGLEYESLAVAERQEALLAGQLALMTQQTLAAPLAAQKIKASGS